MSVYAILKKDVHRKRKIFLKKYTGFIVAGASLLFTAAITLFARRYGELLDAFYPYFSRTAQSAIARVTGIFPFTVWQVLVMILLGALILTLVLMIVRKRSFLRWLGWWLAVACLLWTAHTSLQGLNNYASPLAEDLHMEMKTISKQELEQATAYFRDAANALAPQVPRDGAGNIAFDAFETLAEKAGNGYENLVSAGYSVFAGSTAPVKKLSWGRLYNAMGICGVTMAVTGEAAVVADMPQVSMPYVMCHEMAHRMAIASENDANFAAFLACNASDDIQFRYAGYFTAYLKCMNALGRSISKDEGACDLLRADAAAYFAFYRKNGNQTATNIATAVNDKFLQASGDSQGVKSYGQVVTQLTNWYLQQVAPSEETPRFDPTDADYINGILGENDG